MPDLAAHAPSAASREANPIWRLLDAAGIDWCASHAALEAQFGRTYDDTYQSSSTWVPTRHPAFANMLKPLRLYDASDSPALPPDGFWGSYFDAPHAEATSPPGLLDRLLHASRAWRAALPSADAVLLEIFARTVATFTPLLGDGANSGVSNTIGRTWRSGPATLSLTAWPPSLNEHLGANVYHAREPRLSHATQLVIRPGFQLSASDEELRAVETAVAIDAPLVASTVLRADHPTYGGGSDMLREFLRRIPSRASAAQRAALERLHGVVARSADGQLLLASSPHAMMVVPLRHVEAVLVERCTPARGSGYSQVNVRCRMDVGRGAARTITLYAAPRADDLTEWGTALARALGRPCTVGEYYVDD